VLKEFQVPSVSRGPRVPRVPKDLKDLKVPRVPRVIMSGWGTNSNLIIKAKAPGGNSYKNQIKPNRAYLPSSSSSV